MRLPLPPLWWPRGSGRPFWARPRPAPTRGSHSGAPQPVGSRVATVSLAGATWDVWYGNTGWNVVSYVRQQPANALDVSVKDFTTDAVNRGYVRTAWYLTSVQFGFEPWQGGPGLGVNSFSFTASSAASRTTSGVPARSRATNATMRRASRI